MSRRYRRPVAPNSQQRALSKARQASNRPRLNFDQDVDPSPPLDPSTYPTSRTIRESKARRAPFVVFVLAWVGGVKRPDFHAGTDDRDRAIVLAANLSVRAVVFRGGICVFDNNATIPTK
jgi:hypothetical protein